jgi:hypothetical protein
MSKQWTPRKSTVELRPSRIRRDPAHTEQPQSLVNRVNWRSREWEIRLAIAGIIFFALAINALVIDIYYLAG